MANFLILHGTDGTPDSNWFMWLKGVLIGEGHKVWLPQLPHADKPNTKTYNDFLLSNNDFEFNNETIIIGHSSGAVEILSLLQHLPKDTKIKGAILVGAFKNNLGWDTLTDLFIEPFNFELIKEHCSNFQFVHSDNDPYCPLDHAEYLAEQTDGELTVYEGQGHFSTELSPSYKQFSQILDIIAKVI